MLKIFSAREGYQVWNRPHSRRQNTTLYCMDCTMLKCVFGHMETEKAQIRLRIWAVWSGPSLSSYMKCSKVPDQTVYLHRLIWIFTVSIYLEDTISPVVAHTCILHEGQCRKKAPMQYVNNKSQDLHAHPCNLIWTFSVRLTYTTVSINSISGHWRPRSVCAFAQADLGQHCLKLD